MIKDYLYVVKPWIVFANAVAAVGGFLLAARGQIDPPLLLSTLAGISLVVASGCVCNNCIDRGIDREMVRTRRRALATGAIPARAGRLYAACLGLGGTAVLLFGANLLCLGIVAAGFVVYVGVYSLVLKRRSALSTVAGSLAGAAPPLAAYCAVSNRFDLGALLLLAIFCLWQIPHSYAITIARVSDYAAAKLPVMPVVVGIAATRRRIVWHILAFLLAAQALALCGYAGVAYLTAATAVGFLWLILALARPKDGDDRAWARKVYLFSMLAICVLSLMMSVDWRLPPA